MEGEQQGEIARTALCCYLLHLQYLTACSKGRRCVDCCHQAGLLHITTGISLWPGRGVSSPYFENKMFSPLFCYSTGNSA